MSEPEKPIFSGEEEEAILERFVPLLREYMPDFGSIRAEAREEFRDYRPADLQAIIEALDEDIATLSKIPYSVGGERKPEYLYVDFEWLALAIENDVIRTNLDSDTLSLLRLELDRLSRGEPPTPMAHHEWNYPAMFYREESFLSMLARLHIRRKVAADVMKYRIRFGQPPAYRDEEAERKQDHLFRQRMITAGILLEKKRYRSPRELFRDMEQAEGIEDKDGKTVYNYLRRRFEGSYEEMPKTIAAWREYVRKLLN